MFSRRQIAAIITYTFLATLGAPKAYADERTEFMVKLVKEYTSKRRINGPAGTFDPKIENLQFAIWALQTETPPVGGEMKVADWGYVLQQLQHEGFRFDYARPPFHGNDLTNLVDAKSSGNVRVRDGLVAHYEENLAATRKSIPVPYTEIVVRPSLTQELLPALLAPIKGGEDGKTTLVLNQRAGQMRRLTAAFELMAQTAVGRDILKDLLPQLKTGAITIEAITEHDRQQIEARLGKFHAAYRPEVKWNEERARYELKGRILVNPEAELGSLVEVLVHEARHATDPAFHAQLTEAEVLLTRATEQRRAGRTAAAQALETKAEKLLSDGLLAVEKYAHEGELQFKKQLGEAFPGSKDYYAAKVQRGEGGEMHFTAEYFALGYGVTTGDCVARISRMAP